MAGKGIYTYSVQESQNAGLGQGGSVFIDGTSFTPSKGVIVAITVVADGTIFETLTAAEPNKYASSAVGYEGGGDAIAVGSSGDAFPQGLTIFGRWSTVDINTGSVICYIG